MVGLAAMMARAYLKAHAVGTQNYVGLPSSPGGPLAWKFQGPQATLFLPVRCINGEIRQQVATHYLSPNPGEAGMPARATWQSSIDTSAVWAKKTAESADPACVEAGALQFVPYTADCVFYRSGAGGR